MSVFDIRCPLSCIFAPAMYHIYLKDVNCLCVEYTVVYAVRQRGGASFVSPPTAHARLRTDTADTTLRRCRTRLFLSHTQDFARLSNSPISVAENRRQ